MFGVPFVMKSDGDEQYRLISNDCKTMDNDYVNVLGFVLVELIALRL